MITIKDTNHVSFSRYVTLEMHLEVAFLLTHILLWCFIFFNREILLSSLFFKRYSISRKNSVFTQYWPEECHYWIWRALLMSLMLCFQIYKEQKKPEILVDGWNIYFFDKIEELVSKSERLIWNGFTCSFANEN